MVKSSSPGLPRLPSRLERAAPRLAGPRGRRGFTLVEIVISVLLTAIMAAAVLSVGLTSKRGGGRADRKTAAAQISRQLSSELRNYVTAYYDHASNTWAPAGDMDEIAGPSGGTTSAAWTWESRLGADGATNVVNSTCPNCYALKMGTHRLLNYVPAWLAAAPFNGYAEYIVTIPINDVGGGTNGRLREPQVKIDVYWSEPL